MVDLLDYIRLTDNRQETERITLYGPELNENTYIKLKRKYSGTLVDEFIKHLEQLRTVGNNTGDRYVIKLNLLFNGRDRYLQSYKILEHTLKAKTETSIVVNYNK